MKKNLTLSIDEELLQKARVLAAMRKTSVNEMIREHLEAEVGRETSIGKRAEIWNTVFKRADADKTRRRRRKEVGGIENRLFDREEFYEEVMRERGLL